MCYSLSLLLCARLRVCACVRACRRQYKSAMANNLAWGQQLRRLAAQQQQQTNYSHFMDDLNELQSSAQRMVRSQPRAALRCAAGATRLFDRTAPDLPRLP